MSEESERPRHIHAEGITIIRFAQYLIFTIYERKHLTTSDVMSGTESNVRNIRNNGGCRKGVGIRRRRRRRRDQDFTYMPVEIVSLRGCC